MVQFFKCEKCGNVYEKVYAASGCTPKCCGEATVLLEPKTANPDENKHVPYIEKQADGILVKVGKNDAHPMEADHFIVWIGVEVDGVFMRKDLKAGDKPEAFFPVKSDAAVAYEYCNKHGLWKSQ